MSREDAVQAIISAKGSDAEADIGDVPILDFKSFKSLMSNARNDAYNPFMTVEYQDMTRPLSDYYIASSHNTYLEGDQLTSM